MEKPLSESVYLKKLIDIPRSILKDLKVLAINADKSLKSYIEDILVDQVKKFRQDQP